jgi:hypothetical protein
LFWCNKRDRGDKGDMEKSMEINRNMVKEGGSEEVMK